MFRIVDSQNSHKPVKSNFMSAGQAYQWAKKNLPKDSCSKWGKMNIGRDRYYIIIQ